MLNVKNSDIPAKKVHLCDVTHWLEPQSVHAVEERRKGGVHGGESLFFPSPSSPPPSSGGQYGSAEVHGSMVAVIS